MGIIMADKNIQKSEVTARIHELSKNERIENTEGKGDIVPRTDISNAVIRRLPRYFRFLRELIRAQIFRISSSELSKLMNVTASQIRQDLNCFGGFGQQGYGYNVNYLYTKICEILGVGEGFQAVIIGAGNLGRAFANNTMFNKRGIDVIASFDINPNLIGTFYNNIPIFDMKDLEEFCKNNNVDIVVLCVPKVAATDVAEIINRIGIDAIWNFTGKELENVDPNTAIESVYLGDSLMTLCYDLCRKREADATLTTEGNTHNKDK